MVFTVEGSRHGSRDSWGGKHFEKFLKQENSSIDGDDYWLSEHEGLDQIFVDDRQFEYRIRFHEDFHTQWLLRESVLTIDGLPFLKTECDGNVELSEVMFNIRHPAYQHLGKLNDLIRRFFVPVENDDLVYIPQDYELPEWLSVDDVDETHCWLKISGISTIYDVFSFAPIDWSYNEINSRSCHWLTRLYSDGDADFKILRGYLNFFLVMPSKWASDSCRIHAIPPLRPLPDNLACLEIDRYWQLSAATLGQWWMKLADDVRRVTLGVKSDECIHALPFINDMLTSRDFLETGYAIKGDVKFNFSLDLDELSNFINLDPTSRQDELSGTLAIAHLYLDYEQEGFPVEIADVGVGISQVIPVLFGCWQAMTGQYNIHIQQPELHLHPKLQAQLADVFIKCVNTSESCGIFLLESHSEHLLLRLLRRIRETNQTENPTGNVLDIGKARSRSLKAGQVSVVYVKKDKDGITTMKPLRLADDGEFIDRWPDGFFTDRDIELFGEEGPFA